MRKLLVLAFLLAAMAPSPGRSATLPGCAFADAGVGAGPGLGSTCTFVAQGHIWAKGVLDSATIEIVATRAGVESIRWTGTGSGVLSLAFETQHGDQVTIETSSGCATNECAWSLAGHVGDL